MMIIGHAYAIFGTGIAHFTAVLVQFIVLWLAELASSKSTVMFAFFQTHYSD